MILAEITETLLTIKSKPTKWLGAHAQGRKPISNDITYPASLHWNQKGEAVCSLPPVAGAQAHARGRAPGPQISPRSVLCPPLGLFSTPPRLQLQFHGLLPLRGAGA